MIFDWYRGGDWGGIPVCRLGHIMADLVNASYQAYEYMSNAGAYTAPQYKRGNGNVISFSSAPNAEPSWWDGVPVSSPIIRENYREAFDFLTGLTDELTEYSDRFLKDDYETVVDADYLGIADIDANTLERAQQAWVWARLRTAFERCRYLRRPTRFSGTISTTGKNTETITEPDLGPSPDFYTAPINEAITLAWASASYGDTGTTNPVLYSAVSGFYAPVSAYNPTAYSSGSVKRNASVTFDFRGTDNDMLDLPVMASKLSFRKGSFTAGIPQTSVSTSEGTISDGTELTFGYGVESVTIDMEETTPFDFPDGYGTINTEKYWGYTFWQGGTFSPQWAVYDLHAEDYPS